MMLNSGAGKPPDPALIAEAIAKLVAHFDSVQIFASRHRKGDNKTEHVTGGYGNWYSRYGQIAEWLNVHEMDAYDKHAGRDEDGEEDEDDDDSCGGQCFGSN